VKSAAFEIPLGGKSPQKFTYSVPAQETAKHRAKFGWLPLSDVANAAKTLNILKFAGAPETTETISAASGPKFAILSEHMEEILLLNNFFRLSIHALVAKI